MRCFNRWLLGPFLLGLVACAPTAAPSKQGNPNGTSIDFQSFLGERNYKSLTLKPGTYSFENTIDPSTGQEWLLKLEKPGQKLTLGLLSKAGAVDFLLHGSRLTTNAPAHANTSSSEIKRLDISNPVAGTYYLYALNRTRTAQNYTLVLSLE